MALAEAAAVGATNKEVDSRAVTTRVVVADTLLRAATRATIRAVSSDTARAI